jgi:hypothetical protein
VNNDLAKIAYRNFFGVEFYFTAIREIYIVANMDFISYGLEQKTHDIDFEEELFDQMDHKTPSRSWFSTAKLT